MHRLNRYRQKTIGDIFEFQEQIGAGMVWKPMLRYGSPQGLTFLVHALVVVHDRCYVLWGDVFEMKSLLQFRSNERGGEGSE